MIEHLKNISLFLVIGLLVTAVSRWLQSDFISEFLAQNLITLLIALVAINTTTLSVVLTKIREITDQLGGDFTITAREMKLSIVEQVVLIISSIVVQVIGTSSLLNASFPMLGFVSSVILVAIFSYAIYILYDTANSVFVILRFESSLPKIKGKNDKPIQKPFEGREEIRTKEHLH